MEAIYEFIEADSSESAAAQFKKRSEAVYSLEQYPNRGTVTQAKHLPDHLRRRQTQRCSQRSSHSPRRTESACN
jgi:plasmid stabilization system protein ParE